MKDRVRKTGRTDRELLALHTSGSHEAFDELVQRQSQYKPFEKQAYEAYLARRHECNLERAMKDVTTAGEGA